MLELLAEASARCGSDVQAWGLRAILDEERALVLAELGRLPEAEALLDEIASRPIGGGGFLELRRAEVYLAGGEAERALEIWRRLTADRRFSYYAHRELAEWHGARGEHEERLEHLLRRGPWAPESSGTGANVLIDAHAVELARCELDLGRREDALARLRPFAGGASFGGHSTAELFVDLRVDAGEEALLERELDSWGDAPYAEFGPAAARARLAKRHLLRAGSVTELWQAYLDEDLYGAALCELRERLCAEGELAARHARAALGGPGEERALALLANLGDESILPLLERRVRAAAALWRAGASSDGSLAWELRLLARLRTSAARAVFAQHYDLGVQLGLDSWLLVELP